MFNGSLKETGDVRIVDASSEAFKEFLQFFYVDNIILTMDNIVEVVMLIDKYDIVDDALPICFEFLKDNIVVDDILWSLELAMLFRFNELEKYCENMILTNYRTVFEVVYSLIGDRGPLKAASVKFLSEKGLKHILPHICSIVDNFIAYRMDYIDHLQQQISANIADVGI